MVGSTKRNGEELKRWMHRGEEGREGIVRW